MESSSSEPLSKRKEKKAKRVNKKINLPGSVDVRVQHTNDDSVVSKRSAVSLGYLADPFLRYFVKKPTRRSPLINRGYYLRMLVMGDIVSKCIDFLHSTTTTTEDAPPVQVISLGAGYDTFAMRYLLGQEKKPTQKILFFDVDFDDVMRNKAALMAAAPPGTFPTDWKFQYEEGGGSAVTSPQYHAVGVDLRDSHDVLVERLQKASPFFSTLNPTIVYAECVMQYMPPDKSAELIGTLSSSFETVTLFAYDQLHPQDNFGKVMMNSLSQKQSPLLSIDSVPNGAQMIKRAEENGMRYAAFADFYTLSRFYIDQNEEESVRVNALEPFDEMEEWGEMCEHYGITFSTNSDRMKEFQNRFPLFSRPSSAPPCFPQTEKEASEKSRLASVSAWPSGRFGFLGWGNGEVLKEETENGDFLLVSFGGFDASKQHQRVNTLRVHSLREGELETVLLSSSEVPPAVIFHSFVKLDAFTYLVCGGRSSPQSVSDGVYLIRLNLTTDQAVSIQSVINFSCQKLHGVGDLTLVQRYRHCAVVVRPWEVLLLGGKTENGVCASSHCLVTVHEDRFTLQSVTFPTLPPLYSAAAVPLSNTTVVVTGGLNEQFVASSTIWSLDWKNQTARSLGEEPRLRRFSHTMTTTHVDGKECVVVVGGTSSEPKENGGTTPLLFYLDRKEIVSLPFGSELPHWSRHSSVELLPGVLAIIGGGYTCFSFGTYAAKPSILCIPADAEHQLKQKISLQSPVAATSAHPLEEKSNIIALSAALSRPRRKVKESVFTAEAFLAVAKAAAAPCVFKGVELGNCLQQWADPDYLKSVAGDTVVSVHVAKGTSLLDFVRKNFAFRHVAFRELMDHLTAASLSSFPEEEEERWYYRSIATHMKSERANLWKDFPTLGSDVTLPPGVSDYVLPRMHQACLRINNAPLQLWTHYDTMDNILLQIVGRKRVILFPPSQFNNLYTCGSSSPVIDLDNPDLVQYPRIIEALQHSVEVILEPGDMLYFPANWYHHITTLKGEEQHYVISVNVFFHHFSSGMYDPKDLYGNKDLPAVTQLREHIVRFAEEAAAKVMCGDAPLPSEYKEMALRQAIQDLEKMADTIGASSGSF